MISSYNEWDQLKSVVVGSATNANWPGTDPVFVAEMESSSWTSSRIDYGPVPAHIVAEANTDLDIMAKTLENLGVEVLRPHDRDFAANQGLYNYCPRDRLLVWGDTVVDCAMMYPCRDQESVCYTEVFARAGRVIQMPRDQGMIMDAANVLRLNNQWLFLESASGNRAAYEWLVKTFPDVEIELCNFYAGVHIDSTITPIREGLVLLNGARVTPDNCPRVFDKWEKIYIDDVVPQDFYHFPYASKWIAMNMLVVNPNTVIVDAVQSDLIGILISHGITVIPLQLRHSRTLGGGFHCVTLDLNRSGHK
jgi:scyllo-inosamine-4-phosphate amidinotransferase 1